MGEKNGQTHSAEAERFKQAATDALEMVDWCIGYFVGTHKGNIASALAKSRAKIRNDLMHEPDEPVPTSKG
jgi:hypothetical protein